MKKKKLKNLPEGIRNRVSDLTNAMLEGEYKKGFINGVLFLQEMLDELEDFIERQAIRRAERWFEEEIVPTRTVDELYTSELEEKYGIAYLNNINEFWANQFFARVELEKEILRHEYSQKTNPKGNNSRESLGL